MKRIRMLVRVGRARPWTETGLARDVLQARYKLPRCHSHIALYSLIMIYSVLYNASN